jgi:hypothetical protein
MHFLATPLFARIFTLNALPRRLFFRVRAGEICYDVAAQKGFFADVRGPQLKICPRAKRPEVFLLPLLNNSERAINGAFRTI